MAIFGNLADLPLVDVLRMLRPDRGTLIIRCALSQDVVLVVLDQGIIKKIFRNDQPLDPLQARAELRELIAAETGEFEFTSAFSPPPYARTLEWPVDRVLLSPYFAADQRIAEAAHLPDPTTRFQTISVDPILDEPLLSFWLVAAPLLRTGASAEEMAKTLNLPLERILECLFKLDSVGHITAVRAFLTDGEIETRAAFAGQLFADLVHKRR